VIQGRTQEGDVPALSLLLRARRRGEDTKGSPSLSEKVTLFSLCQEKKVTNEENIKICFSTSRLANLVATYRLWIP